jgi:hypothetical protein
MNTELATVPFPGLAGQLHSPEAWARLEVRSLNRTSRSIASERVAIYRQSFELLSHTRLTQGYRKITKLAAPKRTKQALSWSSNAQCRTSLTLDPGSARVKRFRLPRRPASLSRRPNFGNSDYPLKVTRFPIRNAHPPEPTCSLWDANCGCLSADQFHKMPRLTWKKNSR